MRRAGITLVLALCVLGCGSKGQPITLLTGVESCYAGGQSPSYAGVLVPDPEYGTRIEGKGPVIWPVGFTGMRLASGQVVVFDASGGVIATTGKAYAISPVPEHGGEVSRLMDRLGAIPVADCYAWDFEEAAPQ